MWLGPVCWGYKSGLANDVVPPTYGAFSYRGGDRIPLYTRGFLHVVGRRGVVPPTYGAFAYRGESKNGSSIHGAFIYNSGVDAAL